MAADSISEKDPGVLANIDMIFSFNFDMDDGWRAACWAIPCREAFGRADFSALDDACRRINKALREGSEPLLGLFDSMVGPEASRMDLSRGKSNDFSLPADQARDPASIAAKLGWLAVEAELSAEEISKCCPTARSVGRPGI